MKPKHKRRQKKLVFSELEGMTIDVKEGSPLKVELVEWDLIDKAQRGNISEAFIDDFEICEEGL